MDTPSPDALCPPLEQTRSAVESRLGSVELEGTWRATYVLVHRTERDVLTLKLQDPSGNVRLEREYAADGGTCSTLAQVIALVLERYFLRPDVTTAPTMTDVGRPEVVQPQPLAATLPSAIQENASTAPNPAKADSNATHRASGGRRGFTFDLGLWNSNAWFAPSLGAGASVIKNWSFQLRAGYDLLDHQSAILEGWGSSRRVPGALRVNRRLFDGERVGMDLGIGILGLYERARTSGLSKNGTASRVVPGLEIRWAAEMRPNGAAIGPFLELSTGVLLERLSRPFQVSEQAAFGLPTFLVGLGLGIRTFL